MTNLPYNLFPDLPPASLHTKVKKLGLVLSCQLVIILTRVSAFSAVPYLITAVIFALNWCANLFIIFACFMRQCVY